MPDSPPLHTGQLESSHAQDELSSGKLWIGNLTRDQYDRMPKWCPWASTLIGFNEALNTSYIIQIRCKRWGCRVCGERKARSLAMRVAEAKPNRFMTLTVNPACEASPRSAWQRNTPSIPRLVKKLRMLSPELEYFRVLEVTKAGWPHWHFLLRSGFLAQRKVSQLWEELSGARIVDIRQVEKSFAAYRYCVKYLAKQKYVPWTNRRVTWSRNFFPPPQPFESTFLKFDAKEIIEKPPHFIVTWLLKESHFEIISSDAIAVPGICLSQPRRRSKPQSKAARHIQTFRVAPDLFEGMDADEF